MRVSSGLFFKYLCLKVLWGLLLIFVIGPQRTYGEDIKRDINMEWEHVENSKGYQLQLTLFNSEKEKVSQKIFETLDPKWTAKINPGSYVLKIRSVDSRNVPGPWGEDIEFSVQAPKIDLILPKNKSKINADSNENAKVEFKWKNQNGFEFYKLEIRNEKSEIVVDENVKASNYLAELSVAKIYSWRVTGYVSESVPGEATEFTNQFVLLGKKLENPKIISPESDIVFELRWSEIEYASSYDLALSKQVGKKWKRIRYDKGINGNKIDLPGEYTGGNYKVAIRAKGEKRISSDTSTLNFKVRDGERSPAAIQTERLKQSTKVSNRFIFIASYLLSIMDYRSEHISEQGGGGTQFNAVGGTGRIGFGYQFKDSSLGLLGVLDMSGFSLDQGTYTFVSSELQLTWQKYIGASRLRLGVGAYFKELPSLLRSESVSDSITDSQQYDSNKVSVLGPSIGGQYWLPITEKLGIQVNAQVYYSVLGENIPDGRILIPTLTMQYGLMGSYKLNENMIGFVGYAYRKDTVSYATPDYLKTAFPSSTDGSISIEGHYINFLLDWGF